MSMTAEAYLAPGVVSHGSFVVRTLGGHTSGTVESSGAAGHNGQAVTLGSSDGKAESALTGATSGN
jgi:hypothetical protein